MARARTPLLLCVGALVLGPRAWYGAAAWRASPARAPCALARARPPPPRSGARALLSHAVRVGIHARRLHVPASVHAACVFVRSLLLSRVPWAPETRELCARVCACTLYHAHAHLHTHAHVYTRKHVRTHAQACRGVCALPCDLADAPVSLRMYTYVYMYMYAYVYMCISIHIYIFRERGKERKKYDMCVCVYVCMYARIYSLSLSFSLILFLSFFFSLSFSFSLFFSLSLPLSLSRALSLSPPLSMYVNLHAR